MVVLTETILLERQRRLLLGDPQRRRFFVDFILGTQLVPAMPSAPRNALSPTAADEPHTTSEGGVLYVDSAGHCTFADLGARTLLHWSDGELDLQQILAGGERESLELMNAVAQVGNVEPHPTLLLNSVRCQLSAVAMRDRYDHFWGAALFLQRAH